MPLTSAAELPNHPSLSNAYTSTALPKLTEQSREMLHKERISLAKMKQLLTKFRGDENWVPCGALETNNDMALFAPRRVDHRPSRARSTATRLKEERQEDSDQARSQGARSLAHGGDTRGEGAEDGDMDVDPVRIPAEEASRADTDHTNAAALNGRSKEDVDMGEDDIDFVHRTEPPANTSGRELEMNEHGPSDRNGELRGWDTTHDDGTGKSEVGDVRTTAAVKSETTPNPTDADMSTREGSDKGGGEREQLTGSAPDKELDQDGQSPAPPANEQQQQPPPAHHMTTRRQAHAASGQQTQSPPLSHTSTPSTKPHQNPHKPSVHPLFVIPPEAHPEDRDFGLPAQEAEDTRRLLLLYVQKQEEICRGSARLYEDLLKATRMRDDVFNSCKAEGHAGEMSDGEDWYDREEWGLDAELKKGMDEDDEEGQGQNNTNPPAQNQSQQSHQQHQQHQQQHQHTAGDRNGVGSASGAGIPGDTPAGVGGTGASGQSKRTRNRRAQQ